MKNITTNGTDQHSNTTIIPQTGQEQVTTTALKEGKGSLIKEFFHDENKTPYAEVKTKHRNEIYPIHSDYMRSFISHGMYKRTGTAPTKTQVDQKIATLNAKALYDGDKRKIWIRTAETANGDIEIDLNNKTGQCISVTPDGWEIKDPTNAFYRPKSSLKLPIPEKGGDWNLFKKHFKTKRVSDLELLIGFMIAALRPNSRNEIGNDHTYPILALQGEQGSAKSTTAKMIKSLVDPSKGVNRSLSNKEQDLFIASSNNHLISFDNISFIKNNISDSLCRVSSGGAISARTLYSNDEETLIELCKPVMLNGITDFVARRDLASRSMIVELRPISATERKTGEQVMKEFQDDMPKMLGVLLDGLSASLRNLNKVYLKELPRLADVIIWCTASEEGLNWETGTFNKAYEDNQLSSELDHLATDTLTIALRSFLKDYHSVEWRGQAAELLLELNNHKPMFENIKNWPSSAQHLSQYLNRLSPSLHHIGINFSKSRVNIKREVILKKLTNFNDMNSSNDQEETRGEIIFDVFDNEVTSTPEERGEISFDDDVKRSNDEAFEALGGDTISFDDKGEEVLIDDDVIQANRLAGLTDNGEIVFD